jgi:acetyl esterase/lipase
MGSQLTSFAVRLRLLVIFSLVSGGLLFAAEPKVIDLWPEGVPDLKADAGPEKDDGTGRFTNIHHPTLTVFAPAHPNGTAIIYAPGGGYIRVAGGVNGGEIAKWMNSLGVTVFMLKYRNVEYGHPAPLRDALRAVRILRSRAAEFSLKPDRIGMLGGSAGGHLTASAGTLFDAPEGRTGTELDKISGRPDFLILIFPVITMQEPYGHATSVHALIGTKPTDEMKHHLSVDEQVTKDTPPTFLVHSTADTTVPVENSLLFFTAMRRAKVPIEMHLYPKGPHGSGMDPKLGPTSEWPKHCESWMRFNGWLPQ